MSENKRGSTISSAHRIDPLTEGKLADASKDFKQQFDRAKTREAPPSPAMQSQGSIAKTAENKPANVAPKVDAPKLSQQFERAKNGQQQAALSPPKKRIATAAELKHLQERQKAVLAPQPKPPASVAPLVHREVQQQNQQRVQDLQKQLGSAKDKFERDFDRSKAKGR
jgi:hypothetical protein